MNQKTIYFKFTCITFSCKEKWPISESWKLVIPFQHKGEHVPGCQSYTDPNSKFLKINKTK